MKQNVNESLLKEKLNAVYETHKDFFDSTDNAISNREKGSYPIDWILINHVNGKVKTSVPRKDKLTSEVLNSIEIAIEESINY